jgi:hypothetical protein
VSAPGSLCSALCEDISAESESFEKIVAKQEVALIYLTGTSASAVICSECRLMPRCAFR